MTLIDKAEAPLAPCPFCIEGKSVSTYFDHEQGNKWGYASCDACGARGPEVRTDYDRDDKAPWRAEAIAEWNRRAALPARGVGVKPDAAEMLAKEMQAIVAADRWKGRDLSATPPEKWSHLRPETQQFWIDTATRILAALEPALAPTDAAEAEAHDEQLGVWADELMADLVLNGLMDLVDHDYDTKVGARREIIAALEKANQARAPQIAPTDAAQAREAALKEAAAVVQAEFQLSEHEVAEGTRWCVNIGDFVAKRILDLLSEART